MLISTSCDEEDIAKSNEFTLNSESLKGFLFSDLRIVDYPDSNIKPDFIVLAQTNAHGEVLSPFLSHPDLKGVFKFLKQFDNYESAQTYFDSYSELEHETFVQFGLDIKPNQVWLIKTNNDEFGKVLIISTKYNNHDNKPYAEITFKANMLN